MNPFLSVWPFPPLQWDNDVWESSVVLPAWAGFSGSGTVSDGTAFLNVVTPDDEPVSPLPEQAAAFQLLMEQQGATRDALLAALFARYPEWQKRGGDYLGNEAAVRMPNLARPDELRSLLGLTTVRIFTAAKDSLAYVGFQFNCTWDDEHGLGAMTHRGRVVEVGGADTAILEWIAEQDAETNP